MVRGHQRGRLWGSETSCQVRSTSTGSERVRATVGIASRYGPEPLSAQAAKIADEQQVLELGAGRGQALETHDRLLPASGAARLQRRPEDLLEQRGLAVGGGAEDAQVAAVDAEAGELGRRADDLEVGLVEEQLAVLAARLDDPELLELADQLLARPGLLDEVGLADPLARLVEGDRAALGRPAAV